LASAAQSRIDAADVEVHLRELIDSGGEDLPALITATAEAEERVAAVEESLQRLQAQRQDLQSALRVVEDVSAARQRWRQECEQLASSWAGLRSDIQQALAAGQVEALAELRASADQLSAITEQLASLLGASGLAEEVERQRDHVNSLRATVEELSGHAHK
jgi:chromosome segregation ATPase